MALMLALLALLTTTPVALAFDAENLVPAELEVGCAITCRDKTAPEPHRLCEWTYKRPFYPEVGGVTYRNWADVNLFPNLYAGSVNFEVQCTYFFQGGFPADELPDQSAQLPATPSADDAQPAAAAQKHRGASNASSAWRIGKPLTSQSGSHAK